MLVLMCTASAIAQSPHANKVHEQVNRLGPLAAITINLLDGHEYYGTVGRTGAADFTINEVDRQREVAVRYQDVRKIRSGYGNTRNIQGRRIHPHTRLIVTLAVVGGLLALVFIAVASDHS
jgi:hypothetical protein